MQGSGYAGVGAVVFAVVSPAFAEETSSTAPTVDQCVGAHELGQKSRFDARLATAREAFLTCSSQACPAEVQVDCLRWLREVEALLGRLEVDAGGAAISVDGVVKPSGVAQYWSIRAAIDALPESARPAIGLDLIPEDTYVSELFPSALIGGGS